MYLGIKLFLLAVVVQMEAPMIYVADKTISIFGRSWLQFHQSITVLNQNITVPNCHNC